MTDDTDTIWVVLDYGDVNPHGDRQAIARGAYPNEDDAQERADEVNGPFKKVDIQRTMFHGDLDALS